LALQCRQGAIITAQGIGAAASTTIAGLVASHFGYSAAFVLAACAGVGLVVFWCAMPETAEHADARNDSQAKPQRGAPARRSPRRADARAAW
jgi:MFS family permease